MAKITRHRDDPDARYDNTDLNSKTHGDIVHRDYGAHFFKWGFVGNVSGDKKVLDVGCGSEAPLARTLRMPRNNVPKLYVGVDVRPDIKGLNAGWARYKPEFDFVERWSELKKEFGLFDVIVNLEVIEHMRPADGAKMLAGFHKLLAPDGVAIVSTPVFNGKAAQNHVHEYTREELQLLFQAARLKVKAVYGTFISMDDLKKVAPPEQWELVQRLHGWYGYEVLSTFLAPLYPEQARNNCWILEAV